MISMRVDYNLHVLALIKHAMYSLPKRFMSTLLRAHMKDINNDYWHLLAKSVKDDLR